MQPEVAAGETTSFPSTSSALTDDAPHRQGAWSRLAPVACAALNVSTAATAAIRRHTLTRRRPLNLTARACSAVTPGAMGRVAHLRPARVPALGTSQSASCAHASCQNALRSDPLTTSPTIVHVATYGIAYATAPSTILRSPIRFPPTNRATPATRIGFATAAASAYQRSEPRWIPPRDAASAGSRALPRALYPPALAREPLVPAPVHPPAAGDHEQDHGDHGAAVNRNRPQRRRQQGDRRAEKDAVEAEGHNDRSCDRGTGRAFAALKRVGRGGNLPGIGSDRER